MDYSLVEELYSVIEQGITRPVRCRLDNGLTAVMKYAKNPFGTEALINEWIGMSIATAIGITVPPYGLCYLSEDVIKRTNAIEEIDENNAGLGFYTEYYTNGIPLGNWNARLITNKFTERLILFDYLINNIDRHKGNCLFVNSLENNLVIIDHSHILSKQSTVTEWIANACHETYDILAIWSGYKENKMFDEAKNIMNTIDKPFLNKLRLSIPKEWTTLGFDDRIDYKISLLLERSAGLKQACETIVLERRKA